MTHEASSYYIVQSYIIRIIDVTAFQEVAEQIIGVLALQLYEYGYEGKTEETTKTFEKLFFNTYLFKLALHE